MCSCEMRRQGVFTAIFCRQTPAIFVDTFHISLGSLQPLHFLNGTLLILIRLLSTASFLKEPFLIPGSSQKPFSSVFLCSARHMPILMLHTPMYFVIVTVPRQIHTWYAGVFITFAKKCIQGAPRRHCHPPHTVILALEQYIAAVSWRGRYSLRVAIKYG